MAKRAAKPSARAIKADEFQDFDQAAQPPAKNKGGRPPKLEAADQATIGRLRALAIIHCTQEEACLVLGVTVPTFRKFLADNPEADAAWEEGRAEGKASLRRSQFEMAKTNPTMAIWLGKQYLGQRDIREIAPADGPGMSDLDPNASPRQRLEHIIRRQASAGAANGGAGKPH